MKALAIDCAVSKLTIAAKKDSHTVTLTYDIGMKQSEKLLPAIDWVLKEAELTAKDLDYTTITLGPGSFTGLRLGLSALKALELANKTPIYAIPTLDAYSAPYRTSVETVISVVYGNKDHFYYSFNLRGENITGAKDEALEDILKQIDAETECLVTGPDAKMFCDMVNEITPLYSIHCYAPVAPCTDSLFELAEKMIAEKKQPLAEYEGPLYVRKSEAEIVFDKNMENK